MDLWEAQYKLWSGFGIPAYEENSVPNKKDGVTEAENVEFPYITYQAMSGSHNEDVYPSASIWTRKTSWEQADQLSDAIMDALSKSGERIYFDGGVLWITPNAPFSQSMGDPSDFLIKRKLLSVTLHFL